MGVVSEFVIDIVDKRKEEILKEKRTKVREQCKKVTKEIHSEIIQDWFKGDKKQYNYQSVLDASEKSFSSRSALKDQELRVVTTFFTDINSYKEKPKAEEWRSRPWRNGDHGVPGKVWVLQVLQMTHGIIGLPPHFYRGKYYPAPAHKEPLEDVIRTSSKWDDFESRVISGIK